MPETNNSFGGIKEKEVDNIPARIAEKVREQSKNLTKLTAVDTIITLFPDIEVGSIAVNLADMGKDDKYLDIKSVVAPTGAVYLYSETYITKNQAEILAQAEDIKTKIAEKVRENSKNLIKATDVHSLETLVTGLEVDKVEDSVSEVLQDDRYLDIKSVVASTGAVYLYSETYITKNYADILVRAEVNDPCATIAATVRDESRIYPRPTYIELFNEQVFNIKPDRIEIHINNILERPEFKDIKLINASTGARYLYSNLYMNDDYAKSLVEWQEVDQFENP